MSVNRQWVFLWDGLLLTVLACLACQSGDAQRDLAALDRKVLALVERLQAPLPRFSGSPIAVARYRPVAGLSCLPALPHPQLSMLSDSDRRQLNSLDRAIGRLLETGGDSPAVLRLRALWTLLAKPTPEGRESMILLFQEALKKESASVQRRNDLAAAYLVRASLDGQMDDFAEALELLQPGFAAPSPTSAALFNRVYALQCLTLWRDAEEAWQQIATPMGVVSPDPGAATSGASTLRTRREPGGATPADPAERRQRGEWLLGEWAVQTLQGRAAESGDLLREAEIIAAELQNRSGDSLLRASIQVIQRARADGHHAVLQILMRGHAAFHEVRGNSIYSQCRLETLQTAERNLAAAKSPFVGWVRLDQAICAYFNNDFSHSDEILSALEREAQGRGELALQGRAAWILGLNQVVRARFIEADCYYSRAIEVFSRLGERANVVYLHSLRARSYEYGGARQKAWVERLAALAGRQVINEPQRLFVIFDEAAQALQSHGHRVAALGFLSEQMRAAEAGARTTGKPNTLIFTLLARAAFYFEIGRAVDAAHDVARAEEAASRLSPYNEDRQRLRIEIDLQHALLDRHTNSEQELVAVDRAIEFFASSASSLGGQLQILKLYQLRARIHESRGDFAAARSDLVQAAKEVERQRLEVATMEDRAHFLTQARGLFLELVRLELDHFHDPLAALVALERSSNRVLTDISRAEGALPESLFLTALALHDATPPGTLVVRFGHLPDRLLIWTFLDGRLEVEEHRLPEGQLRREIELCRGLLEHGAGETEREVSCGALARLLLPRRLRYLPAERPVLLVPDDLISPLPLGALRIAPGGPYLIEKFCLSYSPSLTLWSQRERGSFARSDGSPRSALFVSDPAFSRDLFSSFSRLPAAQRAVSSYASHYSRVEILRDRQATVPAVLAALDRFELLQFDGHGLANSQFPERGALLLAPPDSGTADPASSLLSVADLPPRSLRRLRLVILGACSTGLTSYRDTAEVAGLAAALLTRGVPEVLTAAWDIPDGATAGLLDRFHRSLSSGRSAAQALRFAQLDLLRSHPSKATVWAAFQVFEGGKSWNMSVYTRANEGPNQRSGEKGNEKRVVKKPYDLGCTAVARCLRPQLSPRGAAAGQQHPIRGTALHANREVRRLDWYGARG
jgi:tetratricopeptide (TPR) repeat protein